MLNMIVIGATSRIAQETIRHFARDGAHFFLVARSADKLALVASDLEAHGARSVTTHVMDVNAFDQHQPMLDAATEALGMIDSVLIAHGTLSDQEQAQTDVDYMLSEFSTNFSSAAALLTRVANIFEAQGRGSITVISSVAGDRGRGSNYVYGSAMAAKTAFLQGLRNRLAKHNVHVLTVKPGPVDTPMTAHLTSGPRKADPKQVGQQIYRAMKARRDVVYTPPIWRLIMLVIRHIPERIFKKLSL